MKINKKEKLIPELRFKEFKKEWESHKLGEIASFLKGRNISKVDIDANGKYSCIRYGELYTHYKEYARNIISKTNLNKDKLVFSKSNDVIIPASGETAIDISTAVYIDKDDIALGGDLNIIRSPLYGHFLALSLSNKKKKAIARLAQGISVIHLYPEHLKTVEINYPSLLEQQKISSFLSLIDKKIELLNKKKELLEIYKKGIMQKIFNRDIRFKDNNGNDYPEWEEKRLGEIVYYRNGKTHEKDVVENGIYNLITLDSLDINGELKLSHRKVSHNDNSLKENDLVMVLSDVAHGNFLGLVDIIPNNDFVLNQRMASLRLISLDKKYLNYIKYYINYNQRYFKRMGCGSSQLNLSKDDILNFKIYLPNPTEQYAIERFISYLGKEISNNKNQISNLTLFKKSLLQKMFI